MSSKPKYVKTVVELPHRQLTLYGAQRIKNAFAEVTENMRVYIYTRLQILMQAVYEQGLKDGRREVVESLDAIKVKINYMPPGRPRKGRVRKKGSN